ncbi:MAG: GWxTD domain-containing protein [Cytophagales bacterium]
MLISSNFGQTRPSKWNFDYQYEVKAFVKCQYKVWELNDSLGIYLKLTFEPKYAKDNQLHKRYQWNFDYRITSSYDSKINFLQASLISNKYQISDNEYLFYFEIPKIAESSAYMYVAYFQDDKGKLFIQDIPLKILERDTFSEHLLFENDRQTPIFDRYIYKIDSFVVKSAYNNSLIPLHYFKYNFAAALPPMAAVNSGDQEVRLSPDTTIIVKNDSVNLPFKRGNYYIPSVQTKKSFQFLVIENRFPKLSKTKELIEPTIYIATDDERKAMKNTQKPKVKLDDFWLTLAQDKDFARKMIKNYYSKVQEANLLFTNYKEGWKTDMGMIYIIFGKPDQVYRQDLKETWKYKSKQSVPALNFVFNKKINPFYEYFYELQNSEDYATVWYNTVELWRKGILEK